LARRYESLDEDDDPRRREERSVRRRDTLEGELRRAVAAAERTALDAALARAAVFVPLREAGRATLTIALDAMRASSRVLGNEFAQSGVLASPDDVFLLTRHELLEPPANLAQRVNERRRLRAIYEGFELPETWHGMPEKQPIHAGDRQRADRQDPILGRGARLEGLGASAGIHEGIARVVLDSRELAQDFDPGDVLVAPATDPSWAPLFLVAGAVVIDTGSNISHAAVVAREMGIPAVVSARDASRRLRSGQRLRVDGSAGIVEVIA
jgi:pyruvate,water dikinase